MRLGQLEEFLCHAALVGSEAGYRAHMASFDSCDWRA